MRAILFAYLLAGLLAALGSPLLALTMLEPEALCSTDSECMLHCPPPADDPDCDGGPQDPGSALEQARLCKLDSAHCEEAPQ